jgi:hypothetical protein
MINIGGWADRWYDLRMPRTARASVAETWYHVLNRGNRRETVFHKLADYDAFIETLTCSSPSLVSGKWSSLAGWLRDDPLLWRGAIPLRDDRWLERVNEPLSAGDLSRLRLSVERGRPYGAEAWTGETARRLGLESTLRPRGRPPKTNGI